MKSLLTRPPTASEASRSKTDLPDFSSSRTALKPAKPAPTTMQSKLILI